MQLECLTHCHGSCSWTSGLCGHAVCRRWNSGHSRLFTANPSPTIPGQTMKVLHDVYVRTGLYGRLLLADVLSIQQGNRNIVTSKQGKPATVRRVGVGVGSLTPAHVSDAALMYSRRLFGSSTAPRVRVFVVSGSVCVALRLSPLPNPPKVRNKMAQHL